MTQRPPKYWADCPMIGEPIVGTPFIVFKTPITPKSINDSIDPSINQLICNPTSPWEIEQSELFTLSMIVKRLKSRNTPLSLVIDLTDGSFYDGANECSKQSVKYVNLYIPPPNSHATYEITDDHIHAFSQLVDNQLAKNPNQLIGVHDIYGYSVSLYLIGRYMVNQSMIDQSIISSIFQSISCSRPPGLFDRSLVAKLYSSYDCEPPFDLSIIERPEWMTEDIYNFTSSLDLSVNQSIDISQKRTYIWKDASITQSTNSATSLSAEPVKPAGTIRRKQPKKADPTVSQSTSQSANQSTSQSTSQSISQSNDPLKDLLASAGINVSGSIKPSTNQSISQSTTQQPSTIQRKRKPEPATALESDKKPRIEATNQSVTQTSQVPSTRPRSPQPRPQPTNQTTNQPTSQSSDQPTSQSVDQSIIDKHPYLKPVSDPAERSKLLTTFVSLINGRGSQSTNQSTNQSINQSIDQSISQLQSIWSWFDCFELDSQSFPSMFQSKNDCVMSWSPVALTCMILINGESCFLLFRPINQSANQSVNQSTNHMPLFSVPHLSFPQRVAPDQLIVQTICIGELLYDTVNNQSIARLLLHDLLCTPTQPSLPTSLMKRVSIVDSDIVMPRAQSQSVDKGKCFLHIRAKKFFPLNKITSVLSMPLPHPTQGLVIMRNEGMIKVRNRGWLWKKQSSDVTQDKLVSALR